MYEQWDRPGYKSDYRRMTALQRLIVARGSFTSDEASRATWIYDTNLSERLAVWLRDELARLRRLKKRGGAVVRGGKAISRLQIADIAMTIVENADLGDNLICLLLELMDLDRSRLSLAKNNSVARVEAATAEAWHAFKGYRAPGVRELSRTRFSFCKHYSAVAPVARISGTHREQERHLGAKFASRSESTPKNRKTNWWCSTSFYVTNTGAISVNSPRKS